MNMYREPRYREGPTPRGSWRGGYWSERVRPDPDRVFDPTLGRWRKLREDEVAVPVPVKPIPTPWSRPMAQAASSSDMGDLLKARKPHLMSTADILRERYSGVEMYPGRMAELLSELDRRKVFDPEGLAIRWKLI